MSVKFICANLYNFLQLVVTGIEDDCILKTCSQRKSTFPRAFAKLSKNFAGAFQELFVVQNSERKFPPAVLYQQKAPGKLLESSEKSPRESFWKGGFAL